MSIERDSLRPIKDLLLHNPAKFRAQLLNEKLANLTFGLEEQKEANRNSNFQQIKKIEDRIAKLYQLDDANLTSHKDSLEKCSESLESEKPAERSLTSASNASLSYLKTILLLI